MSFTVSGSGGANGSGGTIVINHNGGGGADVELKSTDGSVQIDDTESTAEKKVFDLKASKGKEVVVRCNDGSAIIDPEEGADGKQYYNVSCANKIEDIESPDGSVSVVFGQTADLQKKAELRVPVYEVKSTDNSVQIDDSASTAEKKVFDLSVQASGGGGNVDIFSDDFNYKIEECRKQGSFNYGKLELSKRGIVLGWGKNLVLKDPLDFQEIQGNPQADISLPHGQCKRTSVSLGNDNVLSVQDNFIIGIENVLEGTLSQILGNSNIIKGNHSDNCTIIGDSNIANAYNSVILGFSNEVYTSHGAYVLGLLNRIGTKENPDKGIIVIGWENEDNRSSLFSTIIGRANNNNQIYGGVLLGSYNSRNENFGHIIGSGNTDCNLGGAMLIGHNNNGFVTDVNTPNYSIFIGTNCTDEGFVDWAAYPGHKLPTVFSIGNFQYGSTKKNAIAIDMKGNVKLAGDIYLDMPDGSGGTEQVKLQDLLAKIATLEAKVAQLESYHP